MVSLAKNILVGVVLILYTVDDANYLNHLIRLI